MPVAALILVETSSAGNLGAAMRAAANFSVPGLALVRPQVDPDDAEVLRWACGAHDRLRISHHQTLADAAAPYRTLLATVSGRGRENQPIISPAAAASCFSDAMPCTRSKKKTSCNS